MASKSKGRMCVVAGCNNRPSDTVSVHVFPKDKRQRAAWTRFVRLTRADWTGPSQYTVVCSAHFTDGCFEAQFSLMREFGIPAKKRLCRGAIPSLYPKWKVSDPNLAFLSSPKPKPKRQAAAKLEKNRILSELIPGYESTSKAVSEDRMEVPEIEKMEVDNPEPGETMPKRKGKRNLREKMVLDRMRKKEKRRQDRLEQAESFVLCGDVSASLDTSFNGMQETSTTDGEKCPLKRSRSKRGRAAVHDFEEELYSPVKEWKRTSSIQSSSVHPSDSSSQSYNPIHQESHMESDPMDPSDLIAVKSEPTDSSYIIYIDNAEEPSGMTEMVALS
ncbi:uncharacterized protein LOC125662142 isoform X2 [Ostrea edulis]|uniref:uncharacterized protein LOC125662142 isoform X2 n=1 Tax=Ostrea edulis TaxID=37623 RepID=UPI0024AE8F66|nr:uncharacterized protein LOC125662142 isoform X2 [Ostrea edulis]